MRFTLICFVYINHISAYNTISVPHSLSVGLLRRSRYYRAPPPPSLTVIRRRVIIIIIIFGSINFLLPRRRSTWNDRSIRSGSDAIKIVRTSMSQTWVYGCYIIIVGKRTREVHGVAVFLLLLFLLTFLLEAGVLVVGEVVYVMDAILISDALNPFRPESASA